MSGKTIVLFTRFWADRRVESRFRFGSDKLVSLLKLLMQTVRRLGEAYRDARVMETQARMKWPRLGE